MLKFLEEREVITKQDDAGEKNIVSVWDDFNVGGMKIWLISVGQTRGGLNVDPERLSSLQNYYSE